MTIRDLLKDWQENASAPFTAREYAVRLPLHDAARIMALAELYPGRTEGQLITELLTAALDELEGSLPYVPGERVVSEDDHNDPIYEDVGLTPRFYQLTKHFTRILGEQRRSESD